MSSGASCVQIFLFFFLILYFWVSYTVGSSCMYHPNSSLYVYKSEEGEEMEELPIPIGELACIFVMYPNHPIHPSYHPSFVTLRLFPPRTVFFSTKSHKRANHSWELCSANWNCAVPLSGFFPNSSAFFSTVFFLFFIRRMMGGRDCHGRVRGGGGGGGG
ncbi:hypothetical protein FN846DRAFT_214834 [Sphaerosporella brunnea]|uniref:Uncharacterized protein n=1 Tax=Sphaerosporella brunnea TaxID=1250544 RepID=A0A5J5F7F4_9PEZI|nr:hypothetical protein FN846DRAFT_214834 [Sphaerosporella brunnea]